MNSRRNYDIAFVGLKPGTHEFEYSIDDKFFIEYSEQDFRQCIAQVKLLLEKQNGFMLLKFEIGGKLEVTCDRCGNNLPLEFVLGNEPRKSIAVGMHMGAGANDAHGTCQYIKKLGQFIEVRFPQKTPQPGNGLLS